LIVGFVPNCPAVATVVRNGINDRESGYVEGQDEQYNTMHGSKDIFRRILIAASPM
jgi:hypothetical protein